MARTRNVILSFSVRIVVGLILLAAAVGVAAEMVAKRPQPESSPVSDVGRSVSVVDLRMMPVARRWAGYGTAQAIEAVDVPAEVTAIVRRVGDRVDVGDRVEADALIALLDDSDFKIQEEITRKQMLQIDAELEQIDVEETNWTERLRLAKAEVELVQADYERLRDSLVRGGARPREVDLQRQKLIASERFVVEATEQLAKVSPRQARLAARRAELDAAARLAARNVARCRIGAPLAGTIQILDIEEGETITAGSRCARIVDLSRIEVPLLLPSSARSFISVGDDVALISTGSDRARWPGRVARVAPTDDNTARTMAVYVEVDQDPEAPGMLAPGRYVQGEVSAARTTSRWIVPRRSVRDGRILVVEAGVIASRAVSVDFYIRGSFPQLSPDGQWVVLNDTFEPGTSVILTPSRSLRDGLAVAPVPVTASPAEPAS